MKNTLTNSEIKKRLLRLNNLEKMYANQVKSNKKLKLENKKLKEENEKLRKENKELRDRVEKLELIVEELQKMLFKPTKSSKELNVKKIKKIKKKSRTTSSYRRDAPCSEEITHEQECCVD